ncbi:MAG: ABC transporter substrate-binding protein [Coriobacteriia bacterium]|nr:ABC transporter substrate-binding protein [Coriobacteriia bacterium]
MTRHVRITAMLLVGALVLGALVGCGTETAEEPAATPVAAFPVTITDDAGREVTIEAGPERIVSLAPANTEIVAELGALDRLVGVTTYCDYPAAVTDIEKVGDFVGPNLEAIAALDPDVVLLTMGVQADVVTQLEALGAAVIVIDPQSLDDVYGAIETVGAAIGETDAAAETVASMKLQVEDIAEGVEGVPVRCFLEIAQDPLFTAGPDTLLNDLVERAGGENVVTESGYVAYSVEQLMQADPTVYLATKGSMSEPSDITGRPGFDSLSAVAESRVYLLDDNLVSRPGPRVAEGILQIARALHPDAFGD